MEPLRIRTFILAFVLLVLAPVTGSALSSAVWAAAPLLPPVDLSKLPDDVPVDLLKSMHAINGPDSPLAAPCNCDVGSGGLGPKTEVRYPVFAVRDSKVWEDRVRNHAMFTAAQRAQRRIIIKDGKVLDFRGQPWTYVGIDRQGAFDFVMDAAGNFYVFDEDATPVVRHSAMFAGQPVAGAGEIQIVNGQITMVNDRSGHYPIQGAGFRNVLAELKRQLSPADYDRVTIGKSWFSDKYTK